MFLTTAATRRPVAMTALLIALVALGLNSYRKLSLESLPSVDMPYVTVTTIWPGAAPEDIEKDVAKRIEDAVSGVSGMKHVYSTCIENAGTSIVVPPLLTLVRQPMKMCISRKGRTCQIPPTYPMHGITAKPKDCLLSNTEAIR